MIVERLRLANVRNIESATIELGQGVNLLVGANGAGKTAVLEAVHLLLRRRSFRTQRTREVIRRGAPQMGVSLEGTDGTRGEVRVSTIHDASGKVELRRNGERVRQASAVAALLPVQLMLPDLPDLVFGGPGVRRQWIDWGAFHVKQSYADVQRDYSRALRQRNAALRGMAVGGGVDAALEAWTGQVAELGERLSEGRREYLTDVTAPVTECLQRLAPELQVSFALQQGWNGESLASSLAAGLARDVKSGVTRAGPHRADVQVLFEGEAAASVLSRGQGKVLASALRIGQALDLGRRDGAGGGAGNELAQQTPAGRQTLFLVDDMGAELDEVHGERFFDLLSDIGCQILATTVRPDSWFPGVSHGGAAMFHVEHGRVSRAE